MLPRLPVETRSRRVIFEAMPICEGCGQEGRATDLTTVTSNGWVHRRINIFETPTRRYACTVSRRVAGLAIRPSTPPLREYVLPPLMGPVITVIQHLTLSLYELRCLCGF